MKDTSSTAGFFENLAGADEGLALEAGLPASADIMSGRKIKNRNNMRSI